MKSFQPAILLLVLFITIILGCDQAQNKSSKTNKLTDEQLMDIVQEQTFRYFWDFADPHSGMTKERNTEVWITSGGSGFGVMAIIVGIERNYITREQGLERLLTRRASSVATKVPRPSNPPAVTSS